MAGDQPLAASPRRRRAVKAAAIAGSALLVPWLLFVSNEPSVAPQPPPTAQTIEAGRQAIRQIGKARRLTPGVTNVRFDAQMLRGLSALASGVSGFERLNVRIVANSLSAETSMPLPAGQWLNASVTVRGEHRGFPELHMRAGRLKLPVWAGRWVAEVGRWVVRWKGAPLPPLDRMVRKVAIDRQELVAELDLPKRSGLVDGIMRAQGAQVGARLVARIYCSIAGLQRRSPVAGLAPQIRRAFEGSAAPDAESYNRAAFVALALFVVGRRAEFLAPAALGRTRACGRPAEPILLSNRPDLAKHWTLSAALGATLGDGAAAALGEWKELSDSLPSGSGFSFMDLAADRSGLHAARRAIEPRSAAAAARELATVTEEQLFPIAFLAAQEGLSERQFITRYGSVDAAEYRATVQWIDRELDRARRR